MIGVAKNTVLKLLADTGRACAACPSVCIGTRHSLVCGEPDRDHVSTRYVERYNLTLRMMNRRFTRLTDAFSKKIKNHMDAVSLFTFHYNYCKLHKTLLATPAMAAGVSDHVWELEEVIGLIK
jgi:hypothetical protein